MTRRLTNKLAARKAQSLRWWLCHYADCHVCTYEPDGQFSREGLAVEAANEYVAAGHTRPVRVPRRFWSVLGRAVGARRVGTGRVVGSGADETGSGES